MFYLDTQTNKRYYLSTPFTYNGYFYGTVNANHETFTSLGFTQVTVSERPDERFYNVSDVNDDGTYTSTARDLTELKNFYKLEQKLTVHNTLRGTDWYVIRSYELSETPIPTEVVNHRAAFRAAGDARCAQIDACTTVEELEQLITATPTIYNEVTQTGDPNPDALSQWPSSEGNFSSYDTY